MSCRVTGNEKPAGQIGLDNGIDPDLAIDEDRLIKIDGKAVTDNKGKLDILERYSAARGYLLNGEYGKAYTAFSDLYRINDDPSVREDLALSGYLYGDYNNRHITENDNSISATDLAINGLLASAAAEPDIAETSLLTAVSHAPEARIYRLLLAGVYRGAKYYAEARNLYFGLLIENQDDNIAELSRYGIYTATREEMSFEKERIGEENNTGK